MKKETYVKKYLITTFITLCIICSIISFFILIFTDSEYRNTEKFAEDNLLLPSITYKLSKLVTLNNSGDQTVLPLTTVAQEQLASALLPSMISNQKSIFITKQSGEIVAVAPIMSGLIGKNIDDLTKVHGVYSALGEDAGLQTISFLDFGDTLVTARPLESNKGFVYAFAPVNGSVNSGIFILSQSSLFKFASLLLPLLGLAVSFWWITGQSTSRQGSLSSEHFENQTNAASLHSANALPVSKWVWNSSRGALHGIDKNTHRINSTAISPDDFNTHFGSSFPAFLNDLALELERFHFSSDTQDPSVQGIYTTPSQTRILVVAKRPKRETTADALDLSILEFTADIASTDDRTEPVSLEDTGHAIIQVNQNRRISFINPRFLSFFNIPKDRDFLNSDFETIISQMSPPNWAELDRRELDAGKTSIYHIKLENGDIHQIRESMDENGAFSMTVVDVSSVVAALNLKESETAPTPFRINDKETISKLSHNLKTPLNHIAGFAQALKQEGTPSRNSNSYLKNIIDSSAELSQAIDSLLLHGDIHRDNAVLEIVPTDMSNLITDICDDWKQKKTDSDQQIITDILCRNCVCEIDEDTISHLLDSLLENAFEHSDGADKIIVRLRRSGSRCVISVADTGIGIEKSQINRVFHAFDQLADNMDTDCKNGLGLGLSTAKRISELHGGSLRIKSKSGIGTMVSVTLPLEESNVGVGTITDIPNVLTAKAN